MTKFIKNIGFLFIIIQWIVFSFVLNLIQGVAFENDSLLAESFVLYPYIVYEDDEMIILGSKIVENYYVYDHQGQLQHVYTIPPSGVSYGIFDNETLKIYKVRTRTLYSITIGGLFPHKM